MSEQGDHIARGDARRSKNLRKKKSRTLELLYRKDPFYRSKSEIKNNKECKPEGIENMSKNKPKFKMNGHKDPVAEEKSAKSFFPGRYVTVVVKSSPFSVIKRFLKPKVTSEFTMEELAERILGKICGKRDLQDVLLLITPATDAGVADRYKMHCFILSTKKHMGVTTLKSSELELIKKYHNPKNYILIISTRNIDLKDVALNSPINVEIFEAAKARPSAVRRVWYQGNAVELLYHNCSELLGGVDPEKNSLDFKSVKAPKLPGFPIIQPAAAEEVEQTVRFKKRGPKQSFTSNLARGRRLDRPGNSRRLLFCFGTDSSGRVKPKKNPPRAKEIKKPEEGNAKKSLADYFKDPPRINFCDVLDDTDPNATPVKIMDMNQPTVKEPSKSHKMTLEMARKKRARSDREKAHLAGEKEKERIRLARKKVIAYRNAKLENKNESLLHFQSAPPKSQATRPLIMRNRSISKNHQMYRSNPPLKLTSSNKRQSSPVTSELIFKLEKVFHFEDITNDQPSETQELASSKNDRYYQSSDLNTESDDMTINEALREMVPFNLGIEEPSSEPLFGKIKNLTDSAKIAFLKGEVSTLELKHSFCLFARVVEAINQESCPEEKHLHLFFKFSKYLKLKLFARKECNFPLLKSCKEPRCRIICYLDDDRRDFIATIGILCEQLNPFLLAYPILAEGMRYIHDAFVLTSMPKTLTYCLKSILSKDFYELLGELTYEWTQEPCSMTILAHQFESEELLGKQKWWGIKNWF